MPLDANGAADGTGRNVPPDEQVFAWDALDGLAGATIDARFRSACLVPSVSPVALRFDPVGRPVDLYTDITALSPEQSELDDFPCDAHNSEHGQVTATLAEWILDRLGT
ncbi:hypothetical protein ACFMQL_29615 [Nonomuraea fastidiosa]|uniref:hypothetical protein n=1 Tax=Nonomuraea TaxID=83681 RepID=UPI003446EAEF